MNINTETKYCQTCGIPLDIDYASLEEGQNEYLQLIIPQYFISNKSGIWSLSLIVHSKG